jgi:O-antigen/teichoic acid export membrane protein
MPINTPAAPLLAHAKPRSVSEAAPDSAPVRHPTGIRSVLQIMLLWSGALVGAGLAFLTQAALGRKLGPDDYGNFSAGLAQCILLSQVAGFGLQTFWLSIFGKEGAHASRWMPASVKLLSLTASASVLMLVLLAATTAVDQRSALAMYCLAPSILGFAAVELVAAKLQLEERFLLMSFWQAAHHAARLIIVLIVLGLDSGDLLVQASISYSVVACAVVVYAYLHIRSMTKSGIGLKVGAPLTPDAAANLVPGAGATLRAAWPFCADSFLYIVYFQCSNILLLQLADERAAGLFFAAFNVLNAIYLLPTVLYTKFLLARLHRWAHHDKARLLVASKLGAVAMGLAGLAASIIIWLDSSSIVQLVYGDAFKGTEAILKVLAVCVLLRFLSTSIGAVLTTGQQMMTRVRMKAICAIACITCNLILIPRHGAIGAAVSTVITELCVLVLFGLLVFVRRREIFE